MNADYLMQKAFGFPQSTAPLNSNTAAPMFSSDSSDLLLQSSLDHQSSIQFSPKSMGSYIQSSPAQSFCSLDFQRDDLKTPSFTETRQLIPLYSLDGSESILVKLLPRLDKGFFTLDDGLEWICYRRNYFAASCGFTLMTPFQESMTLPCLADVNGQVFRIDDMQIRIKSNDKENDMIQIPLIQQTAKRDKGPQMIPQPITTQPTHDSASHPANRITRDTLAIFERLQFKFATANNGRRRPAGQRYFTISFELIATTEDGSVHLIAKSTSCPLVVRGRSPNHYADLDHSLQKPLVKLTQYSDQSPLFAPYSSLVARSPSLNSHPQPLHQYQQQNQFMLSPALTHSSPDDKTTRMQIREALRVKNGDKNQCSPMASPPSSNEPLDLSSEYWRSTKQANGLLDGSMTSSPSMRGSSTSPLAVNQVIAEPESPNLLIQSSFTSNFPSNGSVSSLDFSLSHCREDELETAKLLIQSSIGLFQGSQENSQTSTSSSTTLDGLVPPVSSKPSPPSVNTSFLSLDDFGLLQSQQPSPNPLIAPSSNTSLFMKEKKGLPSMINTDFGATPSISFASAGLLSPNTLAEVTGQQPF